jgi:hypothetical protein
MYLTIKAVQSWATLIYIIAGLCSLLIAFDFFMTKDGILRKILIALFLAWSLHYLGAAYLFYLNVPRAILIAFGSLFTTIDFIMLCTLYTYFKWKQ